MVAKLKAIKIELRRRMHDRPGDVGAWLRKVVNGYYQYHAVPGNIRQLSTFRQRINQLWYRYSHAAVSVSARGGRISFRCSNGGYHAASSASLSSNSLLRLPSFTRAVWLDALDSGCCAGGGQRWPSLRRPEQLNPFGTSSDMPPTPFRLLTGYGVCCSDDGSTLHVPRKTRECV